MGSMFPTQIRSLAPATYTSLVLEAVGSVKVTEHEVVSLHWRSAGGADAMPTTIVDLWLLTYEGRCIDIRSPPFSSRRIDREVQPVNWKRREGRTDWMAIDLEEAIFAYLTSRNDCGGSCKLTVQLRRLLN
jgi:hypothetical protein